MTAPEALPISSSRKKKKKNPTGASKESFRKMRRKNQTRKRKEKQAYSSIPPSSSSDYSSDSGNAHTRIRTKENDNYKKKRKRSRRSRSPSRDRTKSKRRKLEGSERKGAKTKLKEKRKRRKKDRLKFGGRDASVSSDLTPRSQSCSTCRSTSPDDLRSGRSSKARSFSRSKKIKKYDDRKLHRGRNRSPIYLSSDHSSRSHSLERIGEKSSLRMSKEAERGNGFDAEDGRMEIITQDHVDFLSSKSNDSFDGSSRREHVDALERYAGKDDYVEGEEEAAFVDYVGNDGRSGPSMRIKSIVVVPAANDAEEEDLESLLRQKALENLKKFRGKSYSLSAKSSIHQNVEDLKTQLPGTSDGRICTEKEYDEDGCSDGVNAAFKENLSVSVGDKADVQGESHQLELSVDTVAKPLRRIVSLTRTKEISNEGEVANPPNVSASLRLVSTKTSSSYTSNIKKHLNSSNQVQSEQENQNENLLKQASVECGISEMVNADQSDKVHQGSTSKTSSTIDQSAGQEITNAPKSEARNDSELEEKTMTVMRGGEMVQVSYKVYIPKKTPALVRRQLKR